MRATEQNFWKFLAKRKEPMQLKTFYLQNNVLSVNFSHCQSEIQFFNKTKLKTLKHVTLEEGKLQM